MYLSDMITTPTAELRFERRAYEKSTAPDDFMRVVIGKEYPTTTAYTLVLQQKWVNTGETLSVEWRDVPIVNEPEKPKPTYVDKMREKLDKALADMTDEEKKRMVEASLNLTQAFKGFKGL